MVKFLKNDRNQVLVFDIFFIIIGALFCFWPDSSMSTLEALTSGILIFYGIFCTVCYLFSSTKNNSVLYQGIFFIIIGLLVSFIASLFVISLGVVLIVQGFQLMICSSELKMLKDKKWYVDFSIGTAFFIFGLAVVILCFTGLASKIISIIVGILLILYGASDLMLIFGFNRNYGDIRKRLIIKYRNEENKSSNNSKTEKPDNYDDYTDYNIN